MKSKKRILVILVLALVLFVIMFFSLRKESYPVIELIGNKIITISVGTEYKDLGAKAYDPKDGDLTDKIIVESNVKSDIPGKYTIIYKVTNKKGKETTKERKIIVMPSPIDNVPPVLTVLGNNPEIIKVNSIYKDKGAIAVDEVDGDLTKNIKVQGHVNTSKPGTYTIVYTVSDKSGNTSSAERKVQVIKGIKRIKDTEKPVITILGNNPLNITYGSSFVDPGATAYDNVDGNISNKINKIGSINTSKLGSYKIIYSVIDSSGNKATAERVINVVLGKDKTPPSLILHGDNPLVLNLYDEYNEPGFKAVDDRDGDITDKVEVSGTVNTNVVGSYRLVYKATDKEGNSTYKMRTIEVTKNNTYTEEELDQMISDGWIPVASANELNQLRESGLKTFGINTKWENTYESGLDKKYVQVENIDLSIYHDNDGWEPIGRYSLEGEEDDAFVFSGKYDGNKYQINNLYVRGDDGPSFSGLFGVVSGRNASLNNIVLNNVDINANYYGSILTTFYESSSPITGIEINGKISAEMATVLAFQLNSYDNDRILIENIKTNIEINGGEAASGLLNQANADCDINNVLIEGNITSVNISSGLISYSNNCNVSNSKVNADITSTGSSGLGTGLMGYSSGGDIINSSFEGTIEAMNVSGLTYNLHGDLINSYVRADLKSEVMAGGLALFSYGNLINNSFFEGTIKSGKVGGLLYSSSAENITISNSYAMGELIAVDTAAGLILSFPDNGVITDSYFKGTVESLTEDAAGLFYLSGLDIINTYVEASIKAKGRAAGITVHNFSNNIENVYFKGDITSSGSNVGGISSFLNSDILFKDTYVEAEIIGNEYVSGFVSKTSNKVILENCYFNGSVFSDNLYSSGMFNEISNELVMKDSHIKGRIEGKNFVGGMISHVSSNLFVQNSYVKSEVIGKDNVGGLIAFSKLENGSNIIDTYFDGRVVGNNNVGGIIGNSEDSKVLVEKVFMNGNIIGNDNVGGFYGIAGADVTRNSFVTGNVTGVSQVGGFAGLLLKDSIIENSYFVGEVVGETNVGAFVGAKEEADEIMPAISSYYNSDVCEVTNTITGSPLTTEEMKKEESYQNWDFNNIWEIKENLNNGFPRLR